MAMELTSPQALTPDSDTETPPPPQPKRPHHTSNPTRHHAPPAVISYRECQKNHAAALGGHALDGCCEFMAGPAADPTRPTSLTCAACGCHRNFHRRDPDDPAPLIARRPHSPPPSASQLLLSLSSSQPSDDSPHPHPSAGFTPGGQNGNFPHGLGLGSSKKRFRTKFSQEQKEKMHDFSEKIGWKLRKGEERLVEDFCKEIGVVRGVFKVWMHNNKHSSSRRERESASAHHAGVSTHSHLSSNGGGINVNASINHNNGNCGANANNVGPHHHHHHSHEFYATHAPNGSAQEAQ